MKPVKRTISYYFAVFFLACLILFPGCEGEDGVIGTGFAQKGPFITGARVVITEIDAQGVEQTDTLKVVLTKDDLGNFDFSTKTNTIYKVIIYGQFLNEITGTVTESRIRLSAIYYTGNSSSKVFGVNMLTNLTTDRIISLIQTGADPASAIAQAQGEVINALNDIIPTDNSLGNFSEMSLFNISNTSEVANAYLLVFSSAIYKAAILKSRNNPAAVERSLGQMTVQLKNQLEMSGLFDEALVQEIVSASRLLNPVVINDNLERLSANVLGFTLGVANMDLFLDTDADGMVNHMDDDIDNDGVLNIDDIAVYDSLIQ